MGQWPIIWTSSTKRVDIETGEELTKYEAEKTFYKLHKTVKYVKYNENHTKGHIEYTKQYRRNPQIQLELK